MRLRKSLYGLHQAPQCWFVKLAVALIQHGFEQSSSDYSLFTYLKGDAHLTTLIYVDDLVIGGNDGGASRRFKTYLNTCFHIKDLGKIKFFWGLEVSCSSIGICLSQHIYALDIISETGLLGENPIRTPI